MFKTSCHVSQVMAEKLPAAVLKRFQDCLISGAPTTEEDQKIIADTLYEWASRLQSREEKRKEWKDEKEMFGVEVFVEIWHMMWPFIHAS